MGGSNVQSTILFKSELELYQDASGCQINYRKIQILGWNCNPREMADVSRILGIEGKTQWDAFKYLGVPIFKTTMKSSNRLPIVDKVKSRINTWGSTWLNHAGKVVLIKVVLSSIPIYYCSILLAPKGIITLIEALLRKFLWKGGKQNEKKLPLVSWEKVSKRLMQGGLQIRNLALGAKILWNIISGKVT